MSVAADEQTPGQSLELDRPIALYPLVYLDEDDQVTVGRADIDSYAILPPDGAALVRQLESEGALSLKGAVGEQYVV